MMLRGAVVLRFAPNRPRAAAKRSTAPAPVNRELVAKLAQVGRQRPAALRVLEELVDGMHETASAGGHAAYRAAGARHLRAAAAAGLEARRHGARARGRWPGGHPVDAARPGGNRGRWRPACRRTRRERTEAVACIR